MEQVRGIIVSLEEGFYQPLPWGRDFITVKAHRIYVDVYISGGRQN